MFDTVYPRELQQSVLDVGGDVGQNHATRGLTKAPPNNFDSSQTHKIIHCLRAPVGGLFRHVLDLATAQSALGHHVGIICAATGDALTEARLGAVVPHLRLGLHRLPMARDLGLADVRAWRHVVGLVGSLKADVLHGHGAKGGAYARLAARAVRGTQADLRCFYTPHGGSLHYAPTTLTGQVYLRLERQLAHWTDGILFESQFAADRYRAIIGASPCPTTVVTNGLLAAEYIPVVTASDAADFVFVGELRMLKGVDVALDALAMVNRSREASLVIVGDGPDAARFRAQSTRLGLDSKVRLTGVMGARAAFALGRVLLVPSRAESLPYIVLEAIAAGIPVIATHVGGIPEIIAPEHGPLLPPGDADRLAAAMSAALERPDLMQQRATALRTAITQRFSVAAMAAGITRFYTEALPARRAA